MSSQSVLLIGASGYIGAIVTKEFLALKSKFSRVAILAEPTKVEKFDEVVQAGIEIVQGSFLDAASFIGFNVVISMLGNHAMKYQPAIIDAALSSGVTHFYPSEYGSDISQGPYWNNRYFLEKRITRLHLEEVVKKHQASGFGYTLILSGGFTEFATVPLFGVDLKKKKFEFFGDVSKHEPFTGVRDVAKYIVASVEMLPPPGSVLDEPCRSFRIPTGSYSWKEIVDTIALIEGVEYERVYRPNSEAIELAKKYAEEGDVDNELAYSLKAIMGNSDLYGVPKPWDNDRFPDITPESIETSLRRVLLPKSGKN